MKQEWIEFLNEINHIVDNLHKNGCDTPFFRGHSNSKYMLVPTLLRGYKDIEYVENSLFYDFVSMAGSQIKGYDSWEVLFNMRHHGVPTRLLDWSTNFMVALYFAIESDNLNKPHIWILNPYKLSYKNPEFTTGLLNPYYDLENDYVKLFVNLEENPDIPRPEFPLVLYPPRINSRIFAQHGVFTLHGTKHEPIEELISEHLIKIDIPVNCIEDAKKFLALSGIHEHSIFPDFDGLAKHLTKKFRSK